MLGHKTKILAIVIVAGILRIFYAIDIPLSGDEVGVGVLQATGQAATYGNRLPKEIVPVKQIEKFVTYSKDFSVKDVLRSLRYAGMHPPFYYLMLHYVLKYIGNDTFTLRLISIFISLVSIVFVYRLGKTVYNENVGWYSALFLAMSVYGVMYGSIVRPYPLAMLLSLISTLQVFELSKVNHLSFNSKKLFLYAIIVLMGLYTIYHFLFVFIFQIAFLVIFNLRNKKTLSVISAMTGIIFVFYLPWMPSLFEQLKDIMQHHYYFHGKINLLLFANSIIYINFIKCILAESPVVVKIFITTIICAIILMGCYSSLKDRKGRIFILALVVYFLSYYVGDTILNTHTMGMRKLLFFIIPISFILLAVGISRIPNRYCIRTISILLCCGLLLCNSIDICYYKPKFDGPVYLGFFRDKINRFLKQNQKGLVIINTAQRRFLLPFAHAIETPIDIKIVHANNVESEILSISNFKDYDFVFIANLYVNYEKQSFFSFQDVKVISNYLTKHDFNLIEPSELGYEPNKTSFMVFEKKFHHYKQALQ